MRAVGSLFTVLALIAVQAPWIACTCEDTAAVTPLLAAPLLHDDHAHDHVHPHACCDALAHAVHGHRHAHGRHCHGAYAHSHAHGEGHHDEAPEPERHDGFRLSYLAVPAPVSLEAADAAPFLALLLEAAGEGARLERRRPLEDPEPPDRPRVPPAAAERLLL